MIAPLILQLHSDTTPFHPLPPNSSLFRPNYRENWGTVTQTLSQPLISTIEQELGVAGEGGTEKEKKGMQWKEITEMALHKKRQSEYKKIGG